MRTALGAGAWLALVLLSGVAVAQDHDVVFLVDQSGSMHDRHGPNRSWAPNDELGNRVEVVLQTFEMLYSRLHSRRDSQTRYRIFVVEFGTRPQVNPPILVTFDAAQPASVLDAKQAVKGRIVARNLGDTDTRAGLREVLGVLTGQTGLPATQVHVILVTDGRPYVERVPTQPGSAYQRDMADVVSAITRRASFDVIGLLGRENRDAYWPEWGPFWSSVSNGQAHAIAHGTDISSKVEEILRNRLGMPPAQSASNPYFCPPYLRSITFTVYKKKRGGRVFIKDANGRVIQDGMPGVTVSSETTYERVSVLDPVPGLWELDRDAANITVDLLYKRVRRTEPRSDANVGVPVTFKYEVHSDKGQPFREMAAYPVSAVLRVRNVRGRTIEIPLNHNGAGAFSSPTAYEADDPGVADLELRATTRLPNGNVVTVFHETEKLPVTSHELLTLHAGTSLPGNVSLLFGRRTLQPSLTTVRLKAPGGQVPLGHGVARPGALAEIRLVKPDGTALSDWRRLTGDPALGAEIRMTLGLLTPAWFRRQQLAYVEVRLEPSALKPGVLIRELRRDPPEPSVDPGGTSPALLGNPLVVPVVFAEPLWSFLLATVTAGVLAVLGLYFTYRYLRELAVLLADKVLGRRVRLIIRPPLGTDADSRIKNLTGDYLLHLRGRRVGILLGDPDSQEAWRPDFLTVKRLWRPFAGSLVVKLTYRLPEAPRAGRSWWQRLRSGPRFRTNLESTIVYEASQRGIRLMGMTSRAEAVLDVRRRTARERAFGAWA